MLQKKASWLFSLFEEKSRKKPAWEIPVALYPCTNRMKRLWAVLILLPLMASRQVVKRLCSSSYQGIPRSWLPCRLFEPLYFLLQCDHSSSVAVNARTPLPRPQQDVYDAASHFPTHRLSPFPLLLFLSYRIIIYQVGPRSPLSMSPLSQASSGGAQSRRGIQRA